MRAKPLLGGIWGFPTVTTYESIPTHLWDALLHMLGEYGLDPVQKKLTLHCPCAANNSTIQQAAAVYCPLPGRV